MNRYEQYKESYRKSYLKNREKKLAQAKARYERIKSSPTSYRKLLERGRTYTKNWKAKKFYEIVCENCGILHKAKAKTARFCSTSCSSTGRFSGSWKGGRNTRQDGYITRYAPEHPNNCKGYVLEHRLIMEQHLKRFLTRKEVVHHIDGNNSNNHIDNLMLFPSKGSHQNFHRKHGQYREKV